MEQVDILHEIQNEGLMGGRIAGFRGVQAVDIARMEIGHRCDVQYVGSLSRLPKMLR